MPHDRMDIGWWIRSTDEELYGPLSRATIWGYVKDGAVSADTLVRHSAAVGFLPIADQEALRDGPASAARRGAPDRLAEVWPRTRRERRALAEGPMRCLRHRRPATQVCLCCLGPYCDSCRPFRGKAFYYCKRCQARMDHARGGALMVDGVLAWVLQVALGAVAATASGVPGSVIAVILAAPTLAFLIRDPLGHGAGPGKRLTGVRVVRETDPTAPLTYGQGFIRSILHLIPFVNLLDLSIVAYRDPLCRRWGDRLAGTRVLFTERKLARIRARALRLIERRVGACLPLPAPTQEELVRLGG